MLFGHVVRVWDGRHIDETVLVRGQDMLFLEQGSENSPTGKSRCYQAVLSNLKRQRRAASPPGTSKTRRTLAHSPTVQAMTDWLRHVPGSTSRIRSSGQIETIYKLKTLTGCHAMLVCRVVGGLCRIVDPLSQIPVLCYF